MIDKKTYELEHIRELQEKYKTDPGLIERVLYAFGLLEALAKVKMPFVFKGGTSLMLLMEQVARLSTDIDIIVEPGTDIDKYIDEAGKIFPFLRKEEQIRKGNNKIIKRHFKFYYYSPVRGTEFYILLDVVFMEPPYDKTVLRPIRNELLISDSDPLMVIVPTAECALGDKLTAFAPHTTGIPLGIGKELEIAKQLYDISKLINIINDFEQVKKTYQSAVEEELKFRGLELNKKDVLADTIETCMSIISRGNYDAAEYKDYLKGMRSLAGHVISERFTPEIAATRACMVMYLAACILTDKSFSFIENENEYIEKKLTGSRYKSLSYMRKRYLRAYAYLVEATNLLEQYN